MNPERARTGGPLVLSLIYFGLVFSAGFVFGVVRTLYVAPAVGERLAELLEAPFMLVVILLAARSIAHRYAGPRSDLRVTGLLAALFVLAADLLVGVGLRGMSPAEVFFDRDLLTGTVYYLLVAAFAALPYALGRNRAGSPGGG